MISPLQKFFLPLCLCFFTTAILAQSDGTPDPNFGTAGISTADNNNNNDEGNDMLLLPENRIMVAGTSVGNDNDFSFCEFTSSGGLFSAFGNSGKLLLDIENGSDDHLNALALDSNLKVVAAGNSLIAGSEYIVVVRLTIDGIPDNTFGVNGIVKLNPALFNEAYDVAIQPDHKIVITGFVNDGLTPLKALIIRLNEDGSYDGAFGDNGVWEGSPDPQYDVKCYSLAIQPDGKLVIGGYHDVNGDRQFAIGRILPGGSMDTGFDTDGWSVKNLTSDSDDVIYSMALQSDGKIVGAGSSNGEVAVWRLNDNGSDDLSFAASGIFTDPLLANDDVLYDVTIQPDNMILCAGGGSIDDNVDFLLLRLATDGIPDAGFDGDGVVYSNFNFNNDYAFSVLLQPDLKILAAGSTINGYFSDFAIARYGNGFTTVGDIEITTSVLLYPNHLDGNGQLWLQGLNKIVSYDIMDASGRICLSGMISPGSPLQLHNQTPGLYLLQMKDNTGKNILPAAKFVVE
jgi:uncharacterized delta-60 repeat protein